MSGSTIKHTDTELTSTQMEPNTKVTGEKTSRTVRARKHGLMAPATKETISKERSLATANLSGQMVQSMKDSFMKITSTAKVMCPI